VLVIGPIGWAALIFGTPLWLLGTGLIVGSKPRARRQAVAAATTWDVSRRAGRDCDPARRVKRPALRVRWSMWAFKVAAGRRAPGVVRFPS
jgi:hypothetical protein